MSNYYKSKVQLLWNDSMTVTIHTRQKNTRCSCAGWSGPWSASQRLIWTFSGSEDQKPSGSNNFKCFPRTWVTCCMYTYLETYFLYDIYIYRYVCIMIGQWFLTSSSEQCLPLFSTFVLFRTKSSVFKTNLQHVFFHHKDLYNPWCHSAGQQLKYLRKGRQPLLQTLRNVYSDGIFPWKHVNCYLLGKHTWKTTTLSQGCRCFDTTGCVNVLMSIGWFYKAKPLAFKMQRKKHVPLCRYISWLTIMLCRTIWWSTGRAAWDWLPPNHRVYHHICPIDRWLWKRRSTQISKYNIKLVRLLSDDISHSIPKILTSPSLLGIDNGIKDWKKSWFLYNQHQPTRMCFWWEFHET